VVYGFLGVLDTFADLILYWVPFFAPLKLAFLVWCWAPYTKGANVIYSAIIQPTFKKHEDKIDAALKSAAENVKSVIDSTSGKSQ
jgi:receptor expression-enhancing protein 5/6